MTDPLDYRIKGRSPVIRPRATGAVVVAFAECNTPPTGTAYLDWDSFYDESAASISDLSSVGFSGPAGGVFTCTEDGFYHVSLILLNQPMMSDANANGIIRVNFGSDYAGWPKLYTAIMNSGSGSNGYHGHSEMGKFHVGDDLYVAQTNYNALAVVSYAVLRVARLG